MNHLDSVLDIISIDFGFFGSRKWSKNYSKKLHLVVMPEKSLKTTIAQKFNMDQDIFVLCIDDLIKNLLNQDRLEQLEKFRNFEQPTYRICISNILKLYLPKYIDSLPNKKAKIVLIHDDIGIAFSLEIKTTHIHKAAPGAEFFNIIVKNLEERGTPLTQDDLDRMTIERNVFLQQEDTNVFSDFGQIIGFIASWTGFANKVPSLIKDFL